MTDKKDQFGNWSKYWEKHLAYLLLIMGWSYLHLNAVRCRISTGELLAGQP